MNNSLKRRCIFLLLIVIGSISAPSQNRILRFENKELELKNVTASVVVVNGQSVLKVERDLNLLPFDTSRLESTVDEPTYVKLKDINFQNGSIEVKMLSQIQKPSPFAQAQGFIGVAFRISPNDTAFESIYLRPRVGRSDNQMFRNHTVQYYSYPHFKFQTLRKLAPELYETSAPVSLDEWITFRIEVKNQKADLFINNAKYSTLIVSPLIGSTKNGSIALWVDIGTIGYFKDIKISN